MIAKACALIEGIASRILATRPCLTAIFAAPARVLGDLALSISYPLDVSWAWVSKNFRLSASLKRILLSLEIRKRSIINILSTRCVVGGSLKTFARHPPAVATDVAVAAGR
jgi:hypothetical protein